MPASRMPLGGDVVESIAPCAGSVGNLGNSFSLLGLALGRSAKPTSSSRSSPRSQATGRNSAASAMRSRCSWSIASGTSGEGKVLHDPKRLAARQGDKDGAKTAQGNRVNTSPLALMLRKRRSRRLEARGRGPIRRSRFPRPSRRRLWRLLRMRELFTRLPWKTALVRLTTTPAPVSRFRTAEDNLSTERYSGA